MLILVRRWYASVSKQHWPFTAVQVGFAVLAFIWSPYHNLPLPGYAVAVIALLAAAMSIHVDMNWLQKMIWMVLIAGFLRIELQAIKKDRFVSDTNALSEKLDIDRKTAESRLSEDASFSTILKNQQQSFTSTAAQLQVVMAKNQRQFDATATRMNDILTMATASTAIAQSNLDAVLGTGGIPCVTLTKTDEGIGLQVENLGKDTLTGVRIEINATHIVKPVHVLSTVINTLVPGVPIILAEKITLAPLRSSPETSAQDRMTDYYIRTWTQNGVYEEDLDVTGYSMKATYETYKRRTSSSGTDVPISVCTGTPVRHFSP